MTDGSRLSAEQMRLLLARGLGAYAVLVPDGAFTVVEASDALLLESSGHCVLVARDGVQALARAAANAFIADSAGQAIRRS